MSQPNPLPQQLDDEIDLMQLFSNIWRTKWRVIISMLVVGAVFLTVQGLRYLNEVPVPRYTQVFDLNFGGLKDGTFPDGSRFVLSDIISPTILSRAYERSDLANFGVSQSDLARAVSVEPFSPDYFLVIERFRQQSSGNRTPAELAALQEQMQAELRRVQSNSVRLSLQFDQGVQVPTAVAQQIMSDIVSIWAQRAIDERGVLRLNMPIYSERIFDEQRFNNLDYLIGIELLINNINLVNQNVAALKREPNAANVRDEVTGLSLEDLSKAISDVREFDLRQLIDPVRELGLARNADTVKLFYNRQLRDLQLERDEYLERARVTREAMNRFSADLANDSNVTPGTSLGTPQLGDAFLDRLVEISRQGSSEEFRQELLREVLRLENRAIDANRRIAEIELLLNALGASARSSETGEEAALRRIYAQEVSENLPLVLEQMREYTQVVGRIHAQLGRQASGNISRLIQPQGGSFREHSSSFISRSLILSFIALMMVTGFIALFAALIQDAMKRRKAS